MSPRDIRGRIRLMPVLILVAMMAFAVRAGDFATGFGSLGVAHAQQEVDAQPPPMTPPEAEAPAEIEGRLDLEKSGETVEMKPQFAADAESKVEAVTPENAEWKDSGDTDIDNSSVREEIYSDLAKRRQDLEKREKEIAVREALLSAAERELDQKLRELKNISAEIEASIKKQTAEEEARIASLVKIYEGMKPKDAASILNTLDIDVLMVIMTKMSERKSSAILAEMNPERARTITVMMAEQQRILSLVPEN